MRSKGASSLSWAWEAHWTFNVGFSVWPQTCTYQLLGITPHWRFTSLAMYYSKYQQMFVSPFMLCFIPSNNWTDCVRTEVFVHIDSFSHHDRLKRLDPQIWLPSLTLFWGIVSICQGLVTNKAGLFGIRFREHAPSKQVSACSSFVWQCLVSPKLACFLVLSTCFQYIIEDMNEAGE